MEINTIIQSSVTPTQTPIEGIQTRTQGSFGHVFESIMKENQSIDGMQQRLEGLQASALKGNSLSPRELLMLQVEMGRFNMHVELVGKVAEAASSTVRRLQGN